MQLKIKRTYTNVHDSSIIVIAKIDLKVLSFDFFREFSESAAQSPNQ